MRREKNGVHLHRNGIQLGSPARLLAFPGPSHRSCLGHLPKLQGTDRESRAFVFLLCSDSGKLPFIFTHSQLDKNSPAVYWTNQYFKIWLSLRNLLSVFLFFFFPFEWKRKEDENSWVTAFRHLITVSKNLTLPMWGLSAYRNCQYEQWAVPRSLLCRTDLQGFPLWLTYMWLEN